MYADLRPESIARIIVGILPIVDGDPEAAIREAFDPQMLDPVISFSHSYLDDVAVACNALHPAIAPSEWMRALYKVNDELRGGFPAIDAQKAIPKWALGAGLFLVGLVLLSKKK